MFYNYVLRMPNPRDTKQFNDHNITARNFEDVKGILEDTYGIDWVLAYCKIVKTNDPKHKTEVS